MRISSTIGHGLDVEIEFDHHSGRAEKQFGDDPHPEEPAELEITKIWATIDPEKFNIIDSICEEEVDLFEDKCWEKVREDAENALDG